MKNLDWLIIFLLCGSLFHSTAINAQQLEMQWAHALNGSDAVANSRIVRDNQGNIYVSGSFLGTLDFDPGSGSTILNSDSLNRFSGFVSKYNQDGNFLHVFAIPGIRIEEMAFNPNGQIVIAGTFTGAVDADPGIGVSNLITNGVSDIFIAIYEADGKLVKAINMGGLDNEKLAHMAVDALGNIYITGQFNAIADFDPGMGVNNLITGDRGSTYMAKYTDNGTLVYAISLENKTDGVSEGVSIAIDSRGRAILGGLFWGSVDFDPGAGESSSMAIEEDAFIVWFDQDGKYISHFNFDGYSNKMALDIEGNLYITGVIKDSMDADPGINRKMLFSYVGDDMYLLKLDSSRELVKSKVFSSKSFYLPMKIATDHNGHIYIVGLMTDDVYFDPLKPIKHHYNNDAYIAGFNSGMEYLYGFSFEGYGNDNMQDLDVQSDGRVWITGGGRNKIDLDPGPDSSIYTFNNESVYFGYYLGIDEQIKIRNSTYFPFKIFSQEHSIFIKNELTQEIALYVNIYSLTGQLVAHYNNLDQVVTRIELPYLTTGIYFVLVTDGRNSLIKKIILE